MHKKKIAAVLGISATLLAGCDDFNPAAEYEMDMYGPAPVMEETVSEEFNPETEYEMELYGPFVEEMISEEYDPAAENEALLYGPAPDME